MCPEGRWTLPSVDCKRCEVRTAQLVDLLAVRECERNLRRDSVSTSYRKSILDRVQVSIGMGKPNLMQLAGRVIENL